MTPTSRENTPAVEEDLSAFIDGELARAPSAFLLRRLAADEGLRGRFDRYHLIGDCLRRQHRGGLAPAELCARVQQALAAETAPPRRSARLAGGMRLAAGAFTAALVAAGAFWFVQPPVATDDGGLAADASEVRASGVSATDLMRPLPLLPVSARSSRPYSSEFAPQPGPEAWQQAPAVPLGYPVGQYIIVVQRPGEAAAAPSGSPSPR